MISIPSMRYVAPILLLWCRFDLAKAIVLFNTTFQSSSESFSYRDDTFRSTTKGNYASGRQVSGVGNAGYLEVTLGGVDSSRVDHMSGGWQRDFTLPQRSTVDIRLNFEILMAAEFETNEFTEALCSIDGVLIGSRPNVTFVGQAFGRGAILTTNWINLNRITLEAGSHRIIIGGYCNKKTELKEKSIVRYSDVVIDYTPVSAPTPAAVPVKVPIRAPTKVPTRAPTKVPTRAPTKVPTRAPTKVPTRAPTKKPTKTPIKQPTETPTKAPTTNPIRPPTKAPTVAPAKAATLAPVPTVPSFALRINAGSNTDYIDPSGRTWVADAYFGNKGDTYSGCPLDIAGTESDALYCKERYFNKWAHSQPFQYDVPGLQAGAYNVSLHFAEVFYREKGKRVFEVWVNGMLIMSALDIVNEAGFSTALIVTTLARVTGSSLVIELVPNIENPKISGIEVVAVQDYVPPPTKAPVTAPFNLLINCGGVGFLESQGVRRWAPDQYFVGGSTYVDGSNGVNGTLDDMLYQSERNGAFKYEIPVPTGSYEVILHFAELYWQGARQRLFNIKIENTLVFSNVDIVALGGGQRLQAITLEAPVIIIDGFVSIEMMDSSPKIDSAKLSGIEINFLQPHLAHSVANGPYINTDIYDTGSATTKVDGTFSHSHGTGLDVVDWTWKEGNTVVGVGPSPNITLPIGVHTITLTIKDTDNNEATDTTTITINPFGFPATVSIVPNTGSISGGQLVTIKGSGFTYLASETTVKFGIVELSGNLVTIVDQFTIVVRTPPTVIGSPVSVSVVTPLSVSNAVTYTYEASSAIAFTSDVLTANIPKPTSAAFGPDGRLYVGTLLGTLVRLTLDESFTTVLSSVTSEVAPFQAILGIAFNPLQTEGLSDVFITTSFFFHGDTASSSGKSINGKIRKVSGANLDTIVDIVTGLPVSDHDHGLTGLEYGDNGEIYIQCASNTNGGIPGRLTSKQVQKDNYYSSATVVANLADPLFDGAIMYSAQDDGIPNGGYGIEVFAAGTRNPWGIFLHSNGNIYASDNGPNYSYGDMMTGCQPGEFKPDVTEGDKINLLRKGGYYGAPNRVRALTHNDTRQCIWRSQFEPSGNGYTAPILKTASSTDGLIEFQTNHFDKQLRGNLIAAKYQGSLYRIVLSPDGNSVIPQSDPYIELTPDVDALDVTQAPDGTLVSSSLDRNAIYFHKPIEEPTSELKLLSVYPRRGGQSGGNTLQLYGTNFDSQTTVSVGGRSCPTISFSATKIECTMPGGIGTVDIVVSSGVRTYNFEQGYRYVTGLPRP